MGASRESLAAGVVRDGKQGLSGICQHGKCFNQAAETKYSEAVVASEYIQKAGRTRLKSNGFSPKPPLNVCKKSPFLNM
jgi:hypothetical protein